MLVSQRRIFPDFTSRQIKTAKSILVKEPDLTLREKIRQALEETRINIKTPEVDIQNVVPNLSKGAFETLKALGFFVASVAPVAATVGLGAAATEVAAGLGATAAATEVAAGLGATAAAAGGAIVIVGGVTYIVSKPFIALFNFIKGLKFRSAAVAPSPAPGAPALGTAGAPALGTGAPVLGPAAPALGTGAPAGTGTPAGPKSDVLKWFISLFSKTPELASMSPEDIFNTLPQKIRDDLSSLGYTSTSREFAELISALRTSINKCDEKNCIDSLINGNDRFNLKIKLEGIIKKLDLNAEDEFAKFKKKVIEMLTDRFSIFAKFQQKVIDELYKIGVPQIPEIKPDFFQILDLPQHQTNIEEMREVYADFDYDKI